MDTKQIAFGADFLKKIDTELAASEVCLVVIGPHWLLSADGQQRLDQPNDVVRYELEAALHRGLRVIPVVVGGARMPRSSELPETLTPLCSLNALDISDTQFHYDVEMLLDVIINPTARPQGSAATQVETLKETIQLSKVALLVTPSVIVFIFFCAWIGFFDYFTLDTKLMTYTMWLGDLVVEPPRTNDVFIIIDEETERVLQKPFDRSWRSTHARLIETLVAAEPKAIVFDLFFEEPSAFDDELLAAIKQATQRGVKVIVGVQKLIAGEPLLIPGLRDVVTGWGMLCIGRRLGYTQTAPLAARIDLTPRALTWSSLGLLAAFGNPSSIALDAATRQLFFHDGDLGRLQKIPFSTAEDVTVPQSACPLLLKGSTVANQFIRLSPLRYWRDPERRLPYQHLLTQNQVPQARFKDKIVLIGVTKLGNDLYRVRHGLSLEERYGIELHADVISNLLTGVYIRPLSLEGQVFLMIVMAVLGALLALWRPSRTFLREVFYGLGVVVYLYVSVILYAAYNILLNVTYQLAAFGISAILMGKMRRKSERVGSRHTLRTSRPRTWSSFLHLGVLLALCPLQMGFTAILVDVVRPDPTSSTAYRSAKVEELSTIKVDRRGQSIPVQRNLSLQTGDEIETRADSTAVLHFSDGHDVFLLPATRIRLGSLVVLFGELLVRARGFFQVETEFMTAGVEGTEFLFRALPRGLVNNSVSVVVLDGSVLCRSKSQRWFPVSVGKAEQFTVRRGLFPAKISASQHELLAAQRQLQQLGRFAPAPTSHSPASLRAEIMKDLPATFSALVRNRFHLDDQIRSQ